MRFIMKKSVESPGLPATVATSKANHTCLWLCSLCVCSRQLCTPHLSTALTFLVQLIVTYPPKTKDSCSGILMLSKRLFLSVNLFSLSHSFFFSPLLISCHLSLGQLSNSYKLQGLISTLLLLCKNHKTKAMCSCLSNVVLLHQIFCREKTLFAQIKQGLAYLGLFIPSCVQEN